ncbi:MAG TPA: polyprenyl synthetase family protein [Candidatus Dormibacteraeota bacterium]|nr:polyprenyl synthetase family protein [Candidatus Dormibacteraeota bacterium]
MAADPDVVSAPMADLFAAGGKRLRPALVLLTARIGTYDLKRLTPAAMAVELTHAATLVHDDVIDRATVRRGRPTIAAQLGDEPAIVVGDFYFAKAYEQAALTQSPEVVTILADAVMKICAGEVRQQAIRYQYDVATLDEYMPRIEAKTATLLAACCDIGALLGGLDAGTRSHLRDYGRLLGLAFQITDDVLDYTGTQDEVGKPIGHDVAEGFATLPLMVAREEPAVARRLSALLRPGHELSTSEAEEVVAVVRSSSGPALALQRARSLASDARRALAAIKGGEAVKTLSALATYVVSRKL